MKLNNQMLLGIGVVIAIVAGLFLYNQQSSTPASQNGANGTADQQESAIGNMRGTLEDLIARGETVQCDFTYTDNQTNDTSEGTVYVSGENVRGNFINRVGEQTYVSHMIRTGETMYLWSDEETQGVKMSINQEELEEYKQATDDLHDDFEVDGDSVVDLEDTHVDYNCRAWNVDQSTFTPPADKEFLDFSAQMEQMQDAMMEQNQGDGVSQEGQCASCEQLPEGEARDACLQSFGC